MSDQGNYRYDVFISYSHTDRAWVWEELLPRLEQIGLRVCIDNRDFEIGTPKSDHRTLAQSQTLREHTSRALGA